MTSTMEQGSGRFDIPGHRFRRLGVCYPGGAAVRSRHRAGVERLRRCGYDVVVRGLEVRRIRSFAGTDAERARVLESLLCEPGIQAVMAGRGGYGCGRLLDELDWELLRRGACPLIGYSDVTALHLGFVRKGVATGFSGPMAAVEFARPLDTDVLRQAWSTTLESLRRAVAGPFRVRLPEGQSLEVLREGAGEGRVIPATLSVLVTLQGTEYLPDMTGALLVLEDVNEAAYCVDRCLNQLKQAGNLQRLSGLVFASFSGGDDREWLPQVFLEYAEHVPGPVVSGLPYGHCFPTLTVPVGRNGCLRAEKGSVEIVW